MLHDDVINEALQVLKQIDSDGIKYNELGKKLADAIQGENTIIAVMALAATLSAIIESPHPENRALDSAAQGMINWHYHFAIGAITKAAMAAGVFDDIAVEIEKALAAENGRSTDH